MTDVELAAVVPTSVRDEIGRRILIVLEEANGEGGYELDVIDRVNLAFLCLNEVADAIEDAFAPVH